MDDKSDTRRDRIHELIQEMGPAEHDRKAVLVGWTIVCDWMDEDGERWLSKAHSASIPQWHADGMRHEALYGDWPRESE
jgi:hypothetical protein